jgi:hypothetical protein
MDPTGGVIPGAKIVVERDGVSGTVTSTTSDGEGAFLVSNVPTATPIHVLISADNFASWQSTAITLAPGQSMEVQDIALKISIATTITVVPQDVLALQQVRAEEKQRLFMGILPNFLTVYDPNPVPLTTKLKFRLAFKTATDKESFGSAAFVGGLYQAADHMSFQQGMKGYGQRVGVAYADVATNVMISGAVLPSLFHQDPRYFYQGTGTKKSRLVHALSSPFIAKGDNGKWQINYSSVGGDLASGALSNVYYPSADRGTGHTFNVALSAIGARMLSAVAQEFLYKRPAPSAP